MNPNSFILVLSLVCATFFKLRLFLSLRLCLFLKSTKERAEKIEKNDFLCLDATKKKIWKEYIKEKRRRNVKDFPPLFFLNKGKESLWKVHSWTQFFHPKENYLN